MSQKSWMEVLESECPELAELSKLDGQFLSSDTALDAKTKYLFAMAFDAIANRPRGVMAYASRARENGATDQQVAEVVSLLRMFFGRPAMVAGADGLRK